MITAIVDLQFGSTGKGLLAGYLSQKNDYDVVVSANMPNAGHTFVDSLGNKWVNKVLPSGVYSPSLHTIAIGPGAVFDPQRLVHEISDLRQRNIHANVVIHPDAAILMPGHKDAEKALNGISSTMQGSMEAVFHKMRRHLEGSNTAMHNCGILSQFPVEVEGEDKDLWNLVCTHNEWIQMMMESKELLVEGSQGYSLGINAGFYPFCTSRDCTVGRLLSDCAVPLVGRLKTIGSARCHPIRVGNTDKGYSGDWYPDQYETSWEALEVEPEFTTVTGRVRRVATFSDFQIREAMLMNGVDEVFLNFCNYDVRYANQIRERIDQSARDIFPDRGTPWGEGPKTVKYMGFGPQAEDIVEV